LFEIIEIYCCPLSCYIVFFFLCYYSFCYTINNFNINLCFTQPFLEFIFIIFYLNKYWHMVTCTEPFLETEENEKILTVAATEDYSGFLVIIYENGKVAKVEMQAYATKTNRKKLTGAYYDKTPVVAIFHLQEDTEFALFSEINKVLLFHTDKVGLKSTRQTMGVQVMRLRKGDTVKRVCTVEESGIQDLDYYRTKGLPATGKFLKEEDREGRQMKLFEPDPAEKGKEK
jgi:DNA gyrase/topoisomerase IV subunit A